MAIPNDGTVGNFAEIVTPQDDKKSSILSIKSQLLQQNKKKVNRIASQENNFVSTNKKFVKSNPMLQTTQGHVRMTASATSPHQLLSSTKN